MCDDSPWNLSLIKHLIRLLYEQDHEGTIMDNLDITEIIKSIKEVAGSLSWPTLKS